MGASASANLACGTDAVVPQEVPTFKVVLVGDPEVGKTSIFLRYTKNQFDYSYQPSMVVNIGNVVKKVNIPYETIVSVTMWDLPGREEMDLRRSYYKDVDAAIVVADLSDPDSIDMAGTWRQDILNNADISEDGEILASRKKKKHSYKSLPILLVGNKLDKVENENDSTADEDATSSNSVKILEEVAELHGFVGCVTVSAKENDGGVHAAMQSLVRYLLDKKSTEKGAQKLGSSSKDLFGSPADAKYIRTLGTAEDHNFVPLQQVGITEFQALFEKCNEKVKTVETASVALLVANKNFKKSCCMAGITDSNKASIEECVTGLKDLIRTENDEDCLEAHEDNGFIKLVLKDEREVPGTVQRMLEIFHKEVNIAAKDVLIHCPTAKVTLENAVNQLDSLHDSAFEKGINEGLTQKQCKLQLAKIRDNRTRIKDTISLADDTMKIVDEEYRRIKTAMMW